MDKEEYNNIDGVQSEAENEEEVVFGGDSLSSENGELKSGDISHQSEITNIYETEGSNSSEAETVVFAGTSNNKP